MAIATNPGSFAQDIKISRKTAATAFYVVVGLIAMSIAIPAALMTGDVGMFDECFAAAEICAAG